MITEALRYPKLGYPIHPLQWLRGEGCSCGRIACPAVGKHPRTRCGVKDATLEEARICAWWARWPEANIGLDVGGAGLIIIDIDPQHGGRVADLPLPAQARETVTVRTGGGGYHLYYRAPPDVDISNSGVLLPEGIDVRSTGGYVVLPPSRHSSGERYQWLPGKSPWDRAVLPLPVALRPLLKVKSVPSQEPIPPSSPRRELVRERVRHPYIQRALENELERLAQATEGHRNETLNRVAFNLGQIVQAGWLEREEVEHLLTEIARAIGLEETEINPTLKSGLEAGLRKPRHHWPDLH